MHRCWYIGQLHYFATATSRVKTAFSARNVDAYRPNSYTTDVATIDLGRVCQWPLDLFDPDANKVCALYHNVRRMQESVCTFGHVSSLRVD